jgi:hypothetical protein
MSIPEPPSRASPIVDYAVGRAGEVPPGAYHPPHE